MAQEHHTPKHIPLKAVSCHKITKLFPCKFFLSAATVGNSLLYMKCKTVVQSIWPGCFVLQEQCMKLGDKFTTVSVEVFQFIPQSTEPVLRKLPRPTTHDSGSHTCWD